MNVRTRKRNIVVPADPGSFATAIVQIFQDAAEADTVEKNLELGVKQLDSAELDFSRYADTLFEVLFAGGRLSTGGNLADEQKEILATNVSGYTCMAVVSPGRPRLTATPAPAAQDSAAVSTQGRQCQAELGHDSSCHQQQLRGLKVTQKSGSWSVGAAAGPCNPFTHASRQVQMHPTCHWHTSPAPCSSS